MAVSLFTNTPPFVNSSSPTSPQTFAFSGLGGGSGITTLLFVSIIAATAPTSVTATLTGNNMTLSGILTGTAPTQALVYVFSICNIGDSGGTVAISWTGGSGISVVSAHVSVWAGTNTSPLNPKPGIDSASRFSQTDTSSVTILRASGPQSVPGCIAVVGIGQNNVGTTNIGPNTFTGFTNNLCALQINSGQQYLTVEYSPVLTGSSLSVGYNNGWISATVSESQIIAVLQAAGTPVTATPPGHVQKAIDYIPGQGGFTQLAVLNMGGASPPTPTVYRLSNALGYDASFFYQSVNFRPLNVPSFTPTTARLQNQRTPHVAYPVQLLGGGVPPTPQPWPPAIVSKKHRRVSKYQFGRRPR